MTLPILASVPHAGLSAPAELEERHLLTPAQIGRDGDEGAREIYAIEDEVAAFVTTEIARAFVDMNRAPDDFRKDGVVKTHTCWDELIYREPLTREEADALVRRHHAPYHAALRSHASSSVRLGVDLHTMAEHGPPVGPDHGAERPIACVGIADGTCPVAWAREFAAALEEGFGERVPINDPFAGGYITRHHAPELPWMQLELSRTARFSHARKREVVLGALELVARRWLS